jgi:hypothetical protein
MVMTMADRSARVLTAAVALSILLAARDCEPALASRSSKTCSSISSRQLQAWFGKPMRPSTIPGIVDCQWVSADASPANLTVQVLSARYYEEHQGRGFSRLAGIGSQAFIVEEMGGWTAGAVKGPKSVTIHIDGGRSGRTTAVAVLTALLATV